MVFGMKNALKIAQKYVILFAVSSVWPDIVPAPDAPVLGDSIDWSRMLWMHIGLLVSASLNGSSEGLVVHKPYLWT